MGDSAGVSPCARIPYSRSWAAEPGRSIWNAMYPVELTEPETESESTPEADRVLSWRCEQFSRLGFGFRARLRLARSAADLALARRLVAAGCQLATAEQILL